NARSGHEQLIFLAKRAVRRVLWKFLAFTFQLVHQNGLYLIARPGPFNMAELKNEGLPFWVRKNIPLLFPLLGRVRRCPRGLSTIQIQISNMRRRIGCKPSAKFWRRLCGLMAARSSVSSWIMKWACLAGSVMPLT
ncbi:hypothetical protein EFT87_04645, partial [Schleiferilactobacillus harbinensis]|nr:hypothetical protein [Schleiferilactobacillus harbinensis]